MVKIIIIKLTMYNECGSNKLTLSPVRPFPVQVCLSRWQRTITPEQKKQNKLHTHFLQTNLSPVCFVRVDLSLLKTWLKIFNKYENIVFQKEIVDFLIVRNNLLPSDVQYQIIQEWDWQQNSHFRYARLITTSHNPTLAESHTF